jgi:hypothetical protein
VLGNGCDFQSILKNIFFNLKKTIDNIWEKRMLNPIRTSAHNKRSLFGHG